MKKLLFLCTLTTLALLNTHIIHAKNPTDPTACPLPSAEILHEQLSQAGFGHLAKVTNLAEKLAGENLPGAIYLTLALALGEYKKHWSANELQTQTIDSMLPHLFCLVLHNCPATLQELVVAGFVSQHAQKE